MSQLDPKARDEADKRFHSAHPEFNGHNIKAEDPDWIKDQWQHFYNQALLASDDDQAADGIEAKCPLEEEKKEWDLFLHCEHKYEKVTRSAVRPSTYELVPRGSANPDPHKFEALTFAALPNTSFDDEKDDVEIYYKDDIQTPPAQIRLIPQEPTKLETVIAKKVRTETSGFAVYKATLRFDRSVMGDAIGFLTTVKVAGYKTTYKIEGIQRPTPTIDVYCPDEWEVSISLPPFAAIKQGAKITGASKSSGKIEKPPAKSDNTAGITYQESSGWMKGDNSKILHTYYNGEQAENFDSSGSSALTPESAIKGFSLKRNGVEIKPGEIVYALISLLKTGQEVLDMIKMIQDMVPKVGYYLEANLQLFQGTFKIAWGRKEYQHWQTFSWIYGGINFTLLNYTFEAGAGAKAYGVVAQIYISTNIKLQLEVKGGVSGPESSKLEIPLTRTETFSAGARFEAGKYFQLGASITTGFSGQIALELSWDNSGSDWKLTGTLKWLGLTADFAASVSADGKGAKWTKSHKVIDEMELFQIEFPKEEKYEPPVMSDGDVSARIVSEFAEMQLEVEEGSTHKQLADILVSGMRSKPIKRTPKNIEALVKEVHSILLNKYVTENDFFYSMIWGNYTLTSDQFLDFVKNDYIPMINSKNYHDQLEDFKKY